MMKCSVCGYENPDGSKFCSECGAKIEYRCPHCGEIINNKSKFCPNCGNRFDSVATSEKSGMAIGDKNVIAGDVYGSKEDYHFAGNATIIQNSDDSKKLNVCSICGKHIPVSEGYTCPECGRFVCSSCYDPKYEKCNDCVNQLKERNEKEYIEFLRKEKIKGPLSKQKFQELSEKGKQYGLPEDIIAVLVKKILDEKGTFVRSSYLSETEQEIIQNSIDGFYENWNEKSTEAEFKKVYSIYKQHENDEGVINALLPLFAKYNIDEARDFIKNINIDSPELYCAKIDLALDDNNVAKAINLMEDAKISYSSNIRIKTKEIELYLICGAALSQSLHTVKAKNLAKNLQIDGNKLERSLIFHARLLAGLYCDDDIDESYLKSQDLYVGYCIDGMHFGVGNIPLCHYSTVMEAVSACPKNGVITVFPGQYEENLVLDKNLTIKKNDDYILQMKYNIESEDPVIRILNKSPVEIGDGITITFKGITFTQTIEEDEDTNQQAENSALFKITGKAELYGISIDGCKSNGLSIGGTANPLICNFTIANTGKSGIYIYDMATPTIESGHIRNCAMYGIESKGKSSPVILHCECSGNAYSGFRLAEDSKGQYKECTAYVNKKSGFVITDSANPVLEKCSAAFNESNGFGLAKNSKGQYKECSASQNEEVGFSIMDSASPALNGCFADHNEHSGFVVFDSAKPVMDDCASDLNKWSGFSFQGKSTGQCKECSASENEQSGFFITGSANPVMEGCDAIQNKYSGFALDSNSAGQYKNCKATENHQIGFKITGSANPVLMSCLAKYNSSSGFGVSGKANVSFIDCISTQNRGRGFISHKGTRVHSENGKANGNWQGNFEGFTAYTNGIKSIYPRLILLFNSLKLKVKSLKLKIKNMSKLKLTIIAVLIFALVIFILRI